MHKRDVQAFYRIADDAARLGPEGEKLAARIRMQLCAMFKEIDDVVGQLHDAPLPILTPPAGSFVDLSLPPGDR